MVASSGDVAVADMLKSSNLFYLTVCWCFYSCPAAMLIVQSGSDSKWWRMFGWCVVERERCDQGWLQRLWGTGVRKSGTTYIHCIFRIVSPYLGIPSGSNCLCCTAPLKVVGMHGKCISPDLRGTILRDRVELTLLLPQRQRCPVSSFL